MILGAGANGSATVGITSAASHVQFRAAVAGPVPSGTNATGLQIRRAFLTALPTAADALTALTASPNAHRDFNIAGEGSGPASTPLGLARTLLQRCAGRGSSADDQCRRVGIH